MAGVKRKIRESSKAEAPRSRGKKHGRVIIEVILDFKVYREMLTLIFLYNFFITKMCKER